jgi:hypothetical protein
MDEDQCWRLDDRDRERMAGLGFEAGLRDQIAERIASRLVEHSDTCRNRHFSVIDDRKPPPFPTHWRFRNSSGASFKRRERAEAQAWVVMALLAGFTVFHQRRKRGWGVGRGLATGVHCEDIRWLYQQLRARGIEFEPLRAVA